MFRPFGKPQRKIALFIEIQRPEIERLVIRRRRPIAFDQFEGTEA
jgi:hypothetical protein